MHKTHAVIFETRVHLVSLHSCCQCSKVLSPSAYATINDTFYCPTHYERMFMARGSYAALQLSTAVTV